MPTVSFDTNASTAGQNDKGFTVSRVATVSGLTGAVAARLQEAINFLGVPIGSAHPGIPGMTLDNIVMVNCPSCNMAVGAVLDLDRVEVGAGVCELTMAARTVAVRVQVWGSGTVIHNSNNSGGTVLLWECYGGRSEYNGQGILTKLLVFGGLFTLENSTADLVTITTTNQDGGTVVEGGMNNATWSTYNHNGGIANVSATINNWTQHAV